MRNLGTQYGTHFVKIWAKNVGFCKVCLFYV